MNQPGPRDFQTPDELKHTPSSAMDMRFGRDSRRRPKQTPEMAPAYREREVKHAPRKKPYERFFTIAFGAIALLMVLGASTFLLPKSPVELYYDLTDQAEAPADEATTDEPEAAEDDRELQGGVKVRKGFKK